MSNDDEMRELHGLYKAFVTKLGAERERHYPQRDYNEFCNWWRELDADVRQSWERDFRMGYDAAIELGERQVADVLKKYGGDGPSAGRGGGR